MHVIVPADAVAAAPMKGAVAQVPLREAAKAGAGGPPLPEGTERFVVSVDGTESEAELASLQVACSGFVSTFPCSWNSRMSSGRFDNGAVLKLSWPECGRRAEAEALPCYEASFYIALYSSSASGIAPQMNRSHAGLRSLVVLWRVPYSLFWTSGCRSLLSCESPTSALLRDVEPLRRPAGLSSSNGAAGRGARRQPHPCLAPRV